MKEPVKDQYQARTLAVMYAESVYQKLSLIIHCSAPVNALGQ